MTDNWTCRGVDCPGNASMRPYRYEPFTSTGDEIRLVHLLPGESGDRLQIRIVHSTLPQLAVPSGKETTSAQVNALRNLVSRPWVVEETESGDAILFNVVTGETRSLPTDAPSSEMVSGRQPRYEAISYTWGNSAATETVHVETDDSRANGGLLATLCIRPNLASALRFLRRPDTLRALWVDAICINQEDIAERNQQVARMTNIYKAAHRVIAWLGDESTDSKHAFATLGHIGLQLQSTVGGRLIAATDAQESDMWRNDHTPSFDDDSWQALYRLVGRPWFYRLWCWQEIKLGSPATVLQCGADTMPWLDFWRAILCLHNKDSLPWMHFRELCRHIVFLKHDSTTSSLCNILDISRSKGCADPRDKIYGLLGITPRYFSSGVAVDYNRSVEDVYKDAFLTQIEATKRLELLKHCDIASRSIGGPSWVPDWSTTEFAAPILSEQLCCGISRAWSIYREPDVLDVVGMPFAAITRVGEVASKLETETLLVVKQWLQCLPQEPSYVTGESMEVAFALTLCMNRTRERHPYNHFLSVAEWVSMLRNMLALTTASSDDPLYQSRETGNTIQKVRGRRLFVTANGYMGTAPAGVQPGDVVCLLLGAYAPLALRETSQGTFQVVGECYVHGLADSVALVGQLPTGWTAMIRGDALGRQTQRFVHGKTGEECVDDPRLGPLPLLWERVPPERLDDDPAMLDKYRNTETGEIINHDPRLSPEALRARGVEIQTLRLV